MNETKHHIPGAAPPQSTKRASIKALRRAANRHETSGVPDPSEGVTDPTALRKARRVRPSRRSNLPELAPADQGTVSVQPSFVGLDMESGSVQHEETHPARRAEAENDTARMTVYVMNAILLIMAFPIGFGMLVFNILGGENLRTTAHVIALTGFGIALTGGAIGSEFLYGI